MRVYKHSEMTSEVKSVSLTQWLISRFQLIILFVLPLLITLINPNWIYNLPGLNNTDTWIYNGLFRYFFDFINTYPSDSHYFVERLSWVLPGHFLYQIFPSIVANFILHLSVFYLCIFTFYGVIKRLFGRDTAFVTILCLSIYTWFLRAVGHDYVDGVGLAYFSAALWAATEAIYQPNFKKYLFVSGVFLGLDVISQLFLGIFVPIIGLYYLMLNWKLHRHPIVTSILWWAMGCLVVILCFMALNFSMAGEFNIFSNSLGFALTKTSTQDVAEIILRDYGITPPTWLVLPCLLMGCSVVVLLRWNTFPPTMKYTFRAVVLFFLLTISVFIYFHHRSAYLHLIIYLYMSFQIPALFLLLAGLINPFVRTITWQTSIKLMVICLTPFILPIVLPELQTVLRTPIFVWGISGCAMLVLTLTLFWKRSPIMLVGTFAIMSLLFSGHNGLANPDRLYGYKIFTATDYTLNVIDALEPEPLDVSRYIVWEDTDAYSAYSNPIRGISQPIYNRGVNWSRATQDFSGLKWRYQFQEELIFLADYETSMTDVEAALKDIYDVEILHAFTLPEIDTTGLYRGYLLRFTRIDSYGEPVFPTGENIYRPTLLAESNARVAWTGPSATPRILFNLPQPRSDIILEVCGVLSTTPVGEQMIGKLNQVEVLFIRQDAKENCVIRYTATVPATAILDGNFTELELDIPTAPASQVLNVNIQALYGLALTSITFYETQNGDS